MTLTKEWLQQTIAEIEAIRDEIPFGLEEYERNMLAAMKLALESLEAEPVAWMVKDTDTGEKIIRSDRSCFEGYCQPLYTTPPAPVSVPDGLYRAVEFYEKVKRENTPVETGAWKDAVNWVLDEACRAAMLQGKTESVREKVLRAQMQSIITDLNLPDDASLVDITNEICRLQGATGNSPAIPDGYALVPIEPTKEMIDAGWSYYMTTKSPSSIGVYGAMLAAAPQQE